MTRNAIQQLAILDTRIETLVSRILSAKGHGQKVDTLERTLATWQESRSVAMNLFLSPHRS